MPHPSPARASPHGGAAWIRGYAHPDLQEGAGSDGGLHPSGTADGLSLSTHDQDQGLQLRPVGSRSNLMGWRRWISERREREENWYREGVGRGWQEGRGVRRSEGGRRKLPAPRCCLLHPPSPPAPTSQILRTRCDTHCQTPACWEGHTHIATEPL